jgi:hypothetical protein
MAKEKYIPGIRTLEPQNTSGGEFVVKNTQEDYSGFYIEDFRGRFYAGKTVEETGVELEKRPDDFEPTLNPKNLLKFLPLLLSFFKPKLKKGDIEKGQTSRYIIQNKNTKQISEVDKDTFFQVQDILPGFTTVEVPWIIKGPAEDKIINGYPYKGAASRNKETIQELESKIPGISAYITDYSVLVVEPEIKQVSETVTSAVDTVPDIGEFRKANFDLRK